MIQRFIYQKEVSGQTLSSLILLLFGLGLVIIHDFEITTYGLILNIFRTISTASSLLSIQSQANNLNASPFQLLILTSPLVSLFVFISSFVVDQKSSITNCVDFKILSFILISCFFAANVNFGAYIVLKRTSAIT